MASEREYIRVQPTDDALSPAAIEAQLRRLHDLETTTDAGWLRRLVGGGADPLTVEILLATPGGPEPRLAYYVGCDDPDALDQLDQLLEALFPRDYERSRTEFQPTELTPEPTPAAAVEYLGHAERRDDWQTRLTPFEAFHTDEATTAPLATVASTLATSPYPAVYQVLVRPKADYTATVGEREYGLKHQQDTLGDWFADKLYYLLTGPPDDDDDLPTAREDRPPAIRTRLEDLETKDARNAFTVNARAVLLAGADTDTAPDGGQTPPATDPEAVAATLETAFGTVDGDVYGIAATRPDPEATWTALTDRVHKPATYTRPYTRLPLTTNRSPGIVADPTECPAFGLLGGADLPTDTRQALAPTPSERTTLPQPPTRQLTTYRTTGLTLGRLLDDADTPTDHVALPARLQPLHVAWFGPTGAGKSVSLTRAGLDNHAATDGADIYLLPKGDGMATDYLRAHYARYGDLDDVYYYDCSEVLPALSFFDITDDLAAGVPRETAVEDRVDHYIELLRGLMDGGFDDAKRAPDVIRYLVRALFDPVHGADAFAHRDLHAAARQMRERQSPPPVSDSALEGLLAGVVASDGDTFDRIMQGVLTRIEKVPVDRRLARLFNHVATADGPALDLAGVLDEDAVILLDTGGLRETAQRALTLAVLSQLWTALRQRAQHTAASDPPLVNCYIEEAASVADTDLLAELLAQSRGFGLSVTLAMQFPGQLQATSPRAYSEVLNNVGTIVTGSVGHDTALAERLATDDMPPGAVANRLRGLRRGQWLASVPAPFDDPSPRPFLLASASPPVGHSASDESLSSTRETGLQVSKLRCTNRTRTEAGLSLAQPSVTTDESDAADDEDADEPPERARVDTTLPYTDRLPAHLTYDADRHALRCTECTATYDPGPTGMDRACDCHPEGPIDPDDIPICGVDLKLTPAERRDCDWTDAQLMFLQAVYNAQQLRYEPPAYDLLYDSMLRLQEYVGIDAAAVDELLEAGLVRHDADHPHRLYTVAPDGRELIGEQHRRGVAHGHGKGDLGESSQHTLGVEIGRRWLELEYVAAPDSAAERVVPYYEPTHDATDASGNADRLDVVALDGDGSVVVAVEVERINHDVAEAVPADYDKMAACDPEEAIWIVMSQSAGHDVLQALNDGAEGEPRVAKSYGETTPPQQYRIDEPGLTAMYPVSWLRDRID